MPAKRAASGADSDADHWITIDGRRWRATDPAIPPAFRKEMVDELMAARRAVAASCRTGDEVAERAARDRVHLAKLALGERGEPWWKEPSPEGRDERLRAAVLTLARHRGPDGTICPSDAARAVGGVGWRTAMDPVRHVVRELARTGAVEVMRRGKVLDADEPWSGALRIRARAV